MSPHPGALVWEALSLICSVWSGGAVFRVQASCLRAGSTTTSVCDVEIIRQFGNLAALRFALLIVLLTCTFLAARVWPGVSEPGSRRGPVPAAAGARSGAAATMPTVAAPERLPYFH